MSDGGSVSHVKMEISAENPAIDNLARAFKEFDFEEGNLITFTEPDNLANSTGKGSIDTDKFAKDIVVRPLGQLYLNGPTHRMYAKSPKGKDYKVADMWLKVAKGSGNPFFYFKANTPGFNAAGNVFSRKGGEWEIVFKDEAKCGACGVACVSCARKG